MAKDKLPKFQSLEEAREFWDTHDTFEVLGEDGWKVAEAEDTKVKSSYLTQVAADGETLRIHSRWLKRIGLKAGDEIRVWVKDGRLVLEPVPSQKKVSSVQQGVSGSRP